MSVTSLITRSYTATGEDEINLGNNSTFTICAKADADADYTIYMKIHKDGVYVLADKDRLTNVNGDLSPIKTVGGAAKLLKIKVDSIGTTTAEIVFNIVLGD